MGQVVPFVARVRDSGDWTAAERARLEDLADQLGEAGIKVEVVFGATDDGDPWCVVTDADGDVLIHVARIGGVFVVHSAVDDALSEGADLHSALRDRLDGAEEAMAPHSATILPFGMTARQAQTLLALVAATAFFYETAGVGEHAEAAELPAAAAHDETPPAPALHDDATAQEREVTTRGAAQSHDDPAPGAPVVHAPTAAGAIPPAPAPAPALPEPAAEPAGPPAPPAPPMAAAAAIMAAPAEPEPAVTTIKGGAGDDLLVGTSGDDHILGGDGDDTLVGGGGHDTLEGGAGDDRLELGEGVVAVGGAGADTFVIHAPIHPNHPETLLGVILDFNEGQGDRLITWRGDMIHVPPHPATDHVVTFSVDRTVPVTTGLTPTGTTPTVGGEHPLLTVTTAVSQSFVRVDVDLDGDGTADGYILVARHGGEVEGAHLDPPGATEPHDERLEGPHADLHDEHPIVVAGHGLMAGGDFGG